MKNIKNIVTNILGLIFWGLSLYEYFNDKNMYFIISFVVVGGVLFLFENKSLKEAFKTVFISRFSKANRNNIQKDNDYSEFI
jgi:uncharacterized membrane protein YqgA involved in biofilm formation